MIYQIKSKYDKESSNNLGFFDNEKDALLALESIYPNSEYANYNNRYVIKLVSRELGLNKKPNFIKKVKFIAWQDGFTGKNSWSLK